MSYPTIVIPPRKTSASNLSNDPEIWKAALASPFTHALVGEMIPERSTSYRCRKLGDPATTAPLTPQTPTALIVSQGTLIIAIIQCNGIIRIIPENADKCTSNTTTISSILSDNLRANFKQMKSGGGCAEIASTTAGMKSTTTQQQHNVSINKAIQEFQRIQNFQRSSKCNITNRISFQQQSRSNRVFHYNFPKLSSPLD
ncbi:hypothetical protein BDR26DRAFT_879643, partial [Obelidium mucronatum]